MRTMTLFMGIGAAVLLLAACSTSALSTEDISPPPSRGSDGQEEGDIDLPPDSTSIPDQTAGSTQPRPEVSGDLPPQLAAITSSWNTDWTQHSVDYSEILSGGPPRDGIPSLDNPGFVGFANADVWLAGTEPVVALEIAGDARAYPLQILTWHEVANDVVGDVPVVVTFCPLCNSAIAFDRQVDGQAYEFGTSGLLRNSDLIMYDRTTESLWQQFTGEGIVGQHTGDQLKFIPVSVISYADFRAAYPNGKVLSQNTGFSRNYGVNPYANYDQSTQPFLYLKKPDTRLPAMMRVVGVVINDQAVAYPYALLSEQGAINAPMGNTELVVFHVFGTNSALGNSIISVAEDVGATGVFNRKLQDETLTFAVKDGSIIDDQTGSTWNIAGQAISGPLAGQSLTPVVHSDHFWFSWAAFYPATTIYGVEPH